jgi:transcriptional antiterminator RfaH
MIWGSRHLAYWAVARTQGQREQAALLHLERQQFEVYLPLIKTMRRIKGEPLFPGYIFVRVVDRWYSIMNTIGITHLLRSGEQPACCPDAVIDDIRKREVMGYVELPKPPKRFQHGQRVRIVRGPFEGHFGLYDGQAPRERCFVLLSLLGSQTRAELADADVAVAPP